MADILGGFGEFGTEFVNLLKYALPIIAVIIMLGFFLYKARERKVYKFPITIISEREGGGTNEYETRGGFVTKKGGAPLFRMKWGFMKSKDIYDPPKLYGITGTNRIYYYQKDIDTFVQLKREIGEEVVKFEPIESDVKLGALLSIQRISQFTQAQGKLEKYLGPILFIAGMVLLLIMFLVMIDKFDPVLMKEVAVETRAAAEALARAKGG